VIPLEDSRLREPQTLTKSTDPVLIQIKAPAAFWE